MEPISGYEHVVASSSTATTTQYGEIVDINLVRDRQTNKSRGFCFIAYEDQRSTVLAVDNLSGAKVAGRTINVSHVDNYKRRKAEVTGEPESSEEEEEEGDDEEESSEEEKDRGTAAQQGGGAFGSMQELMAEAARLRAAGQIRAMGDLGHKQEKKDKEKKKKKDKKKKKKHKDDSRGRGQSRSRSPAYRGRSSHSPRRRSRSPAYRRRHSRSPPARR